MIIVVEGNNAERHTDLLEQMFRARARVFRDKMKWNVDVTDGMERDRYDDEAPVYLLYTDENAKVVKGSLRLLPTTGPTLLAEVFSDTLPDAVFLSAPSIWECTRFCVDAETLMKESREEMLLASCALIEGLGTVALRSGIATVLGNFSPSMLRVYRRIGCEVDVLGCTKRYGSTVYLGSFPVSEQHLRRVRLRLDELRQRQLAHAHEAVLAA
jgi:acyl homoserine lactone synthase